MCESGPVADITSSKLIIIVTGRIPVDAADLRRLDCYLGQAHEVSPVQGDQGKWEPKSWCLHQYLPVTDSKTWLKTTTGFVCIEPGYNRGLHLFSLLEDKGEGSLR